MNVHLFENIEVDLAGTGEIDGESLRNVVLMPRLWLKALKMGEAEWNRAAQVLSVMTSNNLHIAPRLFFITKDIPGLLNLSGIRKLHDKDYTRPCTLERYRKLLHDYTDVAPCRPQVDLIAAIPAERQLNQNDVGKLRIGGFRPSVYINNVNDIRKTTLYRGVGLIFDFSLPKNARRLFLEIALLSSSHFIFWRDGENESKFSGMIKSIHVSTYYQKVFGKL